MRHTCAISDWLSLRGIKRKIERDSAYRAMEKVEYQNERDSQI